MWSCQEAEKKLGSPASLGTLSTFVPLSTVAHMSKCAVVPVFLIVHGFSNYVPYSHFVVIAVVCLYVCGGGGGRCGK